MGKFFRMSNHFNKHSAKDFGLIDNGDNTATDPNDGSLWKRGALYDNGWGSENGYYKVPLPSFPVLLKILLNENDIEDVYGAAAIIESYYPNELLEQCEKMIADPNYTKDFVKMSAVFHLERSLNRCNIVGKTFDQIMADSSRWKKVSEFASRIKKYNERFPRQLFKQEK